MSRRHGPHLRPQIQASEEGAGVTRRREPRLHPHIHASEEGSGTARRIRRRRGTSPAALPFNDDMLREILLHLPPQPSSLPRASAVCKRWRGLVTDPRFVRRFRANHRKPPLLGVFESVDSVVDFVCFRRRFAFRPTLDAPDRIPPRRLDLHRHDVKVSKLPRTRLLGCRHGRVLLMNPVRKEVIVCDPITGDDHHVKVPPELCNAYGAVSAVLCAAADQGHVHGSCHSSPFKVVLMSPSGDGDEDEDEYEEGNRPIACVYSSDTGIWGNIISATTRSQLAGFAGCNPGILVGNFIYWSTKSVSEEVLVSYWNIVADFTDDIIEFDMDRQSLAVIKGPPCLDFSLTHQIIQAENGAVGIAILSDGRLEMWQGKVSCHGGATWLLQKTVEMHTLLGLPPRIEGSMIVIEILGYDEDNGAIFVYVDPNVYMVQLMSMQFKKLYERHDANDCHPFTSFCTPGVAICGGEAEMLHGT